LSRINNTIFLETLSNGVLLIIPDFERHDCYEKSLCDHIAQRPAVGDRRLRCDGKRAERYGVNLKSVWDELAEFNVEAMMTLPDGNIYYMLDLSGETEPMPLPAEPQINIPEDLC
jgi:hypothetical protein